MLPIRSRVKKHESTGVATLWRYGGILLKLAWKMIVNSLSAILPAQCDASITFHKLKPESARYVRRHQEVQPVVDPSPGLLYRP